MEETYNDMLHGRYKLFLRSYITLSRLRWLPRSSRRHVQAHIGVYEELVKQRPSIAQSRARPLEYYYRRGCRWAIVEADHRAKFYKPWTEKQYPAMAQSWQEFYAALEENADVVFRVSPRVWNHPWGLGFDQAPDITIYRLDAQIADAGPVTALQVGTSGCDSYTCLPRTHFRVHPQPHSQASRTVHRRSPKSPTW